MKHVEIKFTMSDKCEKQLYPKITEYKILPTYHTCCLVQSWWPFNLEMQILKEKKWRSVNCIIQTNKQTRCVFVVVLPLCPTVFLRRHECAPAEFHCKAWLVLCRPSQSLLWAQDIKYWSYSCRWKRLWASTVRVEQKMWIP